MSAITTTGCIVQDKKGWFYRDNGDGTFDDLSANGTPKVTKDDMTGDITVLVRDGEPTGGGDRLASRVAVVLAKRYAR